MRNSIRCCISCIFPCGSLDVIRIVHSNGRVEEITGAVKAEQIMKLHPKHVLKKPSSSGDGMCPKIVAVPPVSELQRGKIYFLMPLRPAPEKTRSRRLSSTKRRKKESDKTGGGGVTPWRTYWFPIGIWARFCRRRFSSQRDRRRGRVGVWRPHLESISETPL